MQREEITIKATLKTERSENPVRTTPSSAYTLYRYLECTPIAKTGCPTRTNHLDIQPPSAALQLILILQIFDHIRPIQLVPKSPIIIPRPDTRDDRHPSAPMFLTRDTLRFFHEERPDPLMLEHLGVSRVHADGGSIHVL